jgi:hypothetical protein
MPTRSGPPDPSWTEDNYLDALINACLHNEHAELPRLRAGYAASEYGSQASLVAWDAKAELFQIIAGGTGHFERISDLARSNPTNSEVLASLARAYRYLGEDRQAAKTFACAAEMAGTHSAQFSYLAGAAKSYCAGRDIPNAYAIAEKLRSAGTQSATEEHTLLATLLRLTCDRSFIQQHLESEWVVRRLARVEQRASGGAGRGCAADRPLR